MRDRGVVLINALVVVIAIASVAAALMARAQAARVRAVAVQSGEQIGFHLDAMAALAVQVLSPVGEGGTAVHRADAWAAGTPTYDIGAGRVRAEFADLQGRLNVNWLVGGADDFVDGVFRAVLSDIGLRPGLVAAMRDYVAPGGPRALPQYLRRPLSEQPRGGPVAVLDELRRLPGMTAENFAVFERHFAALPPEARLNLNTAPEPVLRAMLQPFPESVQTEILRPDRPPIAHLREVRDLVIRELETEEIGHLPFERMTVVSQWMQADLQADLDGRRAARRLILYRPALEQGGFEVALSWALRD